MNNVEINEIDIGKINNESSIINFCKKILKERKINNWELSILFCDNKFMKELNNRYRNINSTTDVLSFRQEENLIEGDTNYVGDIIISITKLKENAGKENVTNNEELKRLLIHGILHLEGLDHGNDYERDNMLLIQEKLTGKYTGENIY